MTQAPLRPLSAGEILDQSFGLYRRYLPALATIALVCTAAPQIGLAVVSVQASRAQTAGGMLGILPEYLLLAVVMLILSQLAIGASTLVLAEGYLGRSLATGEALRRAWGSVGKIISLGIMSTLVVGLGLILLIVPGLVLLAGLAVATPALMIEPNLTAGGALSRSWELTRGSKLRMLALMMVPFVILMVAAVGLTMVVGIVAAGAGALKDVATQGPSLGFNIATEGVSLVVRTLLTPLIYCVLTVSYFDLRVRSEGFDLEVLASSIPGAG